MWIDLTLQVYKHVYPTSIMLPSTTCLYEKWPSVAGVQNTYVQQASCWHRQHVYMWNDLALQVYKTLMSCKHHVAINNMSLWSDLALPVYKTSMSCKRHVAINNMSLWSDLALQVYKTRMSNKHHVAINNMSLWSDLALQVYKTRMSSKHHVAIDNMSLWSDLALQKFKTCIPARVMLPSTTWLKWPSVAGVQNIYVQQALCWHQQHVSYVKLHNDAGVQSTCPATALLPSTTWLCEVI